MAGNIEQRELWCQLSRSHVVVADTFAKEALHIKEHLPNLNLPLNNPWILILWWPVWHNMRQTQITTVSQILGPLFQAFLFDILKQMFYFLAMIYLPDMDQPKRWQFMTELKEQRLSQLIISNTQQWNWVKTPSKSHKSSHLYLL